MKKVSFHTLGCRLNFSESGSLASEFAKRGWEIVDFGVPSDVTVINTCTVTDNADVTCRNIIRKAWRTSPEGKTVVIGCYAQVASEEISKLEGVELILGSSEKFKIFDYLEEEDHQIIKIDKTNEFWGASTTLDDYHTRAFLKIQDGCDYICSYCIIPEARGRSRSISIENALVQAKGLIKDGYKEIVLTGVNIGEYEKKSSEKLADLIKTILDIQDLKRLRLSSVEPNTITKEILEIAKSDPRFMDHFHIPMQSGSNKTLQGMRRRYTKEEYEDLLHSIIHYVPTASIGADMIVGFPGESENDFLETYEQAKKLPITHFHVFPFSKRKNTLAAKMEGHLSPQIKKERVSKLVELGEQKKIDFAKTLIGTKNKVLFETHHRNGFWQGHTTTFFELQVESELNIKNVEALTLITGIEGNKLRGKLL